MLEDSQICCKFCQECDVFGLGFEMTPTTDRRPYCTTVDCTILQYSSLYWPVVQTVQYNTCIWFKPERRVLCCCNLSFLAKNRDSATMAMVPRRMMVHSQVATCWRGACDVFKYFKSRGLEKCTHAVQIVANLPCPIQ